MQENYLNIRLLAYDFHCRWFEKIESTRSLIVITLLFAHELRFYVQSINMIEMILGVHPERLIINVLDH